MAQVKIDFKDMSGDVRRELINKMRLAMQLVGEKAEGYAKEECPVDTGLLRNSITYAVAGEGAAITGYQADTPKEGRQSSGTYSGYTQAEPGDNKAAVYVGSNVNYAKYVEYRDAIHKSGKAHFLKDAVMNHKREYVETIRATLEA